MTDIEWACKWVGWEYSSGRIRDGSDPYDRSINDLAEAVRVKGVSEGGYECAAVDEREAATWLADGPLAFIKAVREVIDDGQ